MATATRELEEELGLDANNFDWTPFWTDVYVYDRGVGDRCCFWGFVARATGPEAEIEPRFVDGEVDECFWMNRREVDSCQMPSPVWAFASTLPAPGGLEDCAFFTASS
jgi:8-oxo-dGTP pyrophosphatase MutT (NUDIX family)